MFQNATNHQTGYSYIGSKTSGIMNYETTTKQLSVELPNNYQTTTKQLPLGTPKQLQNNYQITLPHGLGEDRFKASSDISGLGPGPAVPLPK